MRVKRGKWIFKPIDRHRQIYWDVLHSPIPIHVQLFANYVYVVHISYIIHISRNATTLKTLIHKACVSRSICTVLSIPKPINEWNELVNVYFREFSVHNSVSSKRHMCECMCVCMWTALHGSERTTVVKIELECNAVTVAVVMAAVNDDDDNDYVN